MFLWLAMIAFAVTRARMLRLQGWQKLFGVIALVCAVVILLQPEFLALGLFGDTAFFDVLVLSMSLQMHMFATGALRWCAAVLRSCVPRVWIPSPALSYLMAVSTLAVASILSPFQKAAQRICEF
jgi:hypothetical protein